MDYTTRSLENYILTRTKTEKKEYFWDTKKNNQTANMDYRYIVKAKAVVESGHNIPRNHTTTLVPNFYIHSNIQKEIKIISP